MNVDLCGQLFYYLIGFNFVVEYALIILPFMSVQNILKHKGSYPKYITMLDFHLQTTCKSHSCAASFPCAIFAGSRKQP